MMKRSTLKLALVALFATMAVSIQNAYGQAVSINTDGAAPNSSSILDVSSTTKGMLIPRMTLLQRPGSPATGLVIYQTDNTPGFYYFNGSIWLRMSVGGESWSLTGNAATVAGTNFLGTTNAVDFSIKTSSIERLRVLSAGNILMNRTTALHATDLFEAQGDATFPNAINGYTNEANGTGIYGENTTATGAGTGAGVFGLSLQTDAAGVVGSGSTNTVGVLGLANNGTYGGVEGWNANVAGDGIFGYNSAATGAGAGAGVYGYSSQTGAAGVIGSGNTTTRGVLGLTNNANYAGVHAQNSNAGGDALFALNKPANGAGVGSAIYARSNQTGGATIVACLQSNAYYSGAVISAISDWNNASARGLIADVSHGDAIAVYGNNTAASGAGTGFGVYGSIAQSAGIGVEGVNTHTSGTGVMGIGNNATGSYLTAGSGGAFTGTSTGSYSKATTAADGTGVIGVGNNQTANTILGQGSGGAFTGDDYGVYGLAVNSGSGTWGGYFDHGGAAYAYVGGMSGITNYKVLGTGSVSTIVANPAGGNAIMFAPETPEIVFQDYGVSKLVNGKAHIELDPILTKNIFVDDSHPLKVFVQLEGDCNGVYVTNKTSESFDVVELQNGTSNVGFAWSVVANRIDSKDETGLLTSKHVGVRFPVAPERLKRTVLKTNEVESMDDPKKLTISEDKRGEVSDTFKKSDVSHKNSK